MAGSDEP
jgi:TolA-binding protein